VRAIRRFTVRTVLPEPLAPLGELALNLRWSWHAPTRELFASLDARKWAEAREEPARMLGQLSPEELDGPRRDPDVCPGSGPRPRSCRST
jgi:starch phosphorylase